MRPGVVSWLQVGTAMRCFSFRSLVSLHSVRFSERWSGNECRRKLNVPSVVLAYFLVTFSPRRTFVMPFVGSMFSNLAFSLLRLSWRAHVTIFAVARTRTQRLVIKVLVACSSRFRVEYYKILT